MVGKYKMNESQKAEASNEAGALIASGVNPEMLVHVIYYPDNSSFCDESIMGLSTPISHEEWAKGGLTCKYYRLQDLV